MKYWLVCCYVGHCGRGKNPREIALAVEAETSVKAMLIARKFPGVKHHRSQHLCYTREITKEEYLERKKTNAYDKALR